MNCPVKKRYTAPSLESIAIDQEITLVMDSTPPGGQGEGAPAVGKTIIKKSTKTSSPFGGTNPDYSKMQ